MYCGCTIPQKPFDTESSTTAPPSHHTFFCTRLKLEVSKTEVWENLAVRAVRWNPQGKDSVKGEWRGVRNLYCAALARLSIWESYQSGVLVPQLKESSKPRLFTG